MPTDPFSGSRNSETSFAIDPVIADRGAVQNSGITAVALMEAGNEFPDEFSAITEYANGTGNLRDIFHPVRVLKLLQDFGGTRLDGAREAFSAALLHDIGERAQMKSEESSLALSSLRKYRESVSPEYWRQVAAYLTDMPISSSYVQLSRSSTGGDGELTDIPEGNGEAQIPLQYWMRYIPLAPKKLLNEAVSKVNIETLLIEAVELIDNMDNPSRSSRAVMRDVIDSQSFYSVICEAMGLDGIASALASRSNILRLRKMGLQSVTDEAEHQLTGYTREVVKDVAEGVISELINPHGKASYSFDDSTEHGVIIGESIFSRGVKGEDRLRAIWRLKSLGSYAMKLFRKGGERPLDTVGLTIITKNQEQLQDVFNQLVINAQASLKLRLAGANPGESGIYIRGDKKYIKGIKTALKEVGVDVTTLETEKNNHKREFRVAKITIDYKGHPVEVMVQTQGDRERSRLGKRASHTAYKSSNGEGGLRSVRNRASKIGSGAITQSLERVKALDALLDAAA